MKEESKIWFLQAEEHFDNMEFLYKNSRYSLSVYCAHQALEMILKAAIVEFVSQVPPKSHNLDHLLELTTLPPVTNNWYEELAVVTKHYWRVRYPDYRKSVYTSKEKVTPTITLTREIFLWVKDKLKNI